MGLGCGLATDCHGSAREDLIRRSPGSVVGPPATGMPGSGRHLSENGIRLGWRQSCSDCCILAVCGWIHVHLRKAGHVLQWVATPQCAFGQVVYPERMLGQVENPEQILGQVEDPEHTLGQAEDPAHTLGQAEDPEHTTGHVEDPEHTLGHVEDPEHMLGHVEDPEHTLGYVAVVASAAELEDVDSASKTDHTAGRGSRGGKPEPGYRGGSLEYCEDSNLEGHDDNAASSADCPGSRSYGLDNRSAPEELA